mgnify:CR=1 FL=1
MLAEILIITNNPMVNNINNAEICFVKGDNRQVFYEVLNKVATGHKLITHPLAGNIKPEDNPYRSVAVSKSKAKADLAILAKLNQYLDKIEANQMKRKVNLPSIMTDFQLIDKDLIENAIQNYHKGR